MCLRTVCHLELRGRHGLAAVATVLRLDRVEEVLVGGNGGVGRHLGVSLRCSILAGAPDEQSNQTKKDYNDDGSDDTNLEAGRFVGSVTSSQVRRASSAVKGRSSVVVVIIVACNWRHDDECREG